VKVPSVAPGSATVDATVVKVPSVAPGSATVDATVVKVPSVAPGSATVDATVVKVPSDAPGSATPGQSASVPIPSALLPAAALPAASSAQNPASASSPTVIFVNEIAVSTVSRSQNLAGFMRYDEVVFGYAAKYKNGAGPPTLKRFESLMQGDNFHCWFLGAAVKTVDNTESFLLLAHAHPCWDPAACGLNHHGPDHSADHCQHSVLENPMHIEVISLSHLRAQLSMHMKFSSPTFPLLSSLGLQPAGLQTKQKKRVSGLPQAAPAPLCDAYRLFSHGDPAAKSDTDLCSWIEDLIASVELVSEPVPEPPQPKSKKLLRDNVVVPDRLPASDRPYYLRRRDSPSGLPSSSKVLKRNSSDTSRSVQPPESAHKDQKRTRKHRKDQSAEDVDASEDEELDDEDEEDHAAIPNRRKQPTARDLIHRLEAVEHGMESVRHGMEAIVAYVARDKRPADESFGSSPTSKSRSRNSHHGDENHAHGHDCRVECGHHEDRRSPTPDLEDSQDEPLGECAEYAQMVAAGRFIDRLRRRSPGQTHRRARWSK
jgi:hypothetical protein